MEFTGHRIEIVLCIVYCYQARQGPVVVVVVCHNLHRSLFTCWCCVGIFGHTTIVYYAFDLVLLSSKVACFLSNKFIVKSLEIKKRSEMISLVNTDTMIENEPYSNGKCQVLPNGQITNKQTNSNNFIQSKELHNVSSRTCLDSSDSWRWLITNKNIQNLLYILLEIFLAKVGLIFTFRIYPRVGWSK